MGHCGKDLGVVADGREHRLSGHRRAKAFAVPMAIQAKLSIRFWVCMSGRSLAGCIYGNVASIHAGVMQ